MIFGKQTKLAVLYRRKDSISAADISAKPGRRNERNQGDTQQSASQRREDASPHTSSLSAAQTCVAGIVDETIDRFELRAQHLGHAEIGIELFGHRIDFKHCRKNRFLRLVEDASFHYHVTVARWLT